MDPLLERFRSDRKRRLFACACVREVWHLLKDERSRRAVEVAEAFAEGRATKKELHAAFAGAWDAANLLGRCEPDYRSPATDPIRAGWAAFNAAAHSSNWASWEVFRDEPPEKRLLLLEDIAGPDPLPEVPRTQTVVALAQAIYDQRRWQDLPVLADSLEEAGCTDAGILSHLRAPGPHALGCWAVDAVLGKE
jgi:hypothetical protein